MARPFCRACTVRVAERPAVAHLLNMEQDRELIGPRQEEIAVAAVDDEVIRDGLLRGGHAHGGDSTSP